MTGYNPNLDLVSMNAYKKNGDELSVYAEDIERKQISGIKQGP